MKPALIDTLFRNIHNLKGSSALYNLTGISRLTHALEDSLEKYRDDSNLSLSSQSIDLILSTIDFIKIMILEVKASGSDSKFENKVVSLISDIHTNFGLKLDNASDVREAEL